MHNTTLPWSGAMLFLYYIHRETDSLIHHAAVRDQPYAGKHPEISDYGVTPSTANHRGHDQTFCCEEWEV